jgi:hypothetical protein
MHTIIDIDRIDQKCNQIINVKKHAFTLKQLNIWVNNLKNIQDISYLLNLKVLCLKIVDYYEIESKNTFGKLESLESILFLGDFKFTLNSNPKYLKSLIDISFHNCFIDNKFVNFMCKLNKLERININSCTIAVDDLLKLSTFKNIKIIELSDIKVRYQHVDLNDVSDLDYEPIKKLLKNKKIKFI